MLARVFFTLETITLRHYYALLFIELGSRPVHLADCSTNPTGTWVTQQACNRGFTGLFERTRFLIPTATASSQSEPFVGVVRTHDVKPVVGGVRVGGRRRLQEVDHG